MTGFSLIWWFTGTSIINPNVTCKLKNTDSDPTCSLKKQTTKLAFIFIILIAYIPNNNMHDFKWFFLFFLNT